MAQSFICAILSKFFYAFSLLIFPDSLSHSLEWADKLEHRMNCSQIFFKIGVLKKFAIFTVEHLCLCLFLIKLLALRAATLLKRVFKTRVFYCEYCEIFKNSFFYRTPLMAASRVILIDDSLCLFTLEKKQTFVEKRLRYYCSFKRRNFCKFSWTFNFPGEKFVTNWYKLMSPEKPRLMLFGCCIFFQI